MPTNTRMQQPETRITKQQRTQKQIKTVILPIKKTGKENTSLTEFLIMQGI